MTTVVPVKDKKSDNLFQQTAKMMTSGKKKLSLFMKRINGKKLACINNNRVPQTRSASPLSYSSISSTTATTRTTQTTKKNCCEPHREENSNDGEGDPCPESSQTHCDIEAKRASQVSPKTSTMAAQKSTLHQKQPLYTFRRLWSTVEFKLGSVEIKKNMRKVVLHRSVQRQVQRHYDTTPSIEIFDLFRKPIKLLCMCHSEENNNSKGEEDHKSIISPKKSIVVVNDKSNNNNLEKRSKVGDSNSSSSQSSPTTSTTTSVARIKGAGKDNKAIGRLVRRVSQRTII
eukprot:m.184540 g.184540  ORF g.184540 m.184540 type:complete len:287 (+) comp13598_c0_seq1:3792-4652(+)